MSAEEKPVDARRLTVSAWAAIALLGVLLSATAGGAWRVATVLARIEARFDKVDEKFEENRRLHADLDLEFWPRKEASVYHHDLEKALQKLGLKVDFPPPADPLTAPRPHS
jgi:hypothetical protein